MKKLLLTAAALLATLNMYGQSASGILAFNNGNATTPSGNRVWANTTGVAGDGALAAGTGYHVGLYWGPQGTPESGLTQIGASANFANPYGGGVFAGGNRTVTYPGTTPGGVVTVQVRGWTYLGAGTPDTYEQALALGAQDSRYWVGKSVVFDHDSSEPGNAQDVPVGVGANPAWRGFAISPVPEPSVIGLGLLGAGALLMLRRRK